MATNGSDSGVVPAIDTTIPEQPEFNPLEMLMQAAAAQQDAEEAAAEEPEIDYNKPLTDGVDGYAIYSSQDAAEQAMGLGNGGEADQWEKKLTANQLDGLKLYTSNTYHEINNWMRKLSTNITQSVQERIPSLQHALDKYTLQAPIVTHRGTGPEFLGLPANASTKQIMARVNQIIGSGLTVTDFGFTSSGVSTSKAWPKKVVVHTQTPAGKGIGAFVSGVAYFGKGENEFLYNSGTQIQFLGAYVSGDTVHINARYKGRDKSTNNAKHITEAPGF